MRDPRSGSKGSRRAASALTVLIAAGAAAIAVLPSADAKNASPGALTPKGCIEDTAGLGACADSGLGLAGATALAMSPDGRSLYAVSEGSSTIAILDRDKSTGKLDSNGCVEQTGAGVGCAKDTIGLAGAGSVAVSNDGKSVYVASEDGAIARFQRDTHSGKLKPKGCVGDNDTGEPGCSRHTDGLAGATSVVVSRNDRSVYAGSEGDSAVVTFKRNTRTGALKPRGCIDDNDPGQGVDNCADSTNGLSQTGAITMSKDGKSLYATSEEGMLVRFDIKAKGKLKPEGCFVDKDRVAPDNCAKKVDGLTKPESVAVSPDGKSVYVTGGSGQNSIVRFDRDSDGSLKAQGCIEDNDAPTGDCDKDANGMGEGDGVAVSPDSKSVYYGSGEDSAIVRFDRSTSGALKYKGCIDDPTGLDNCAESAAGLEKVTGIVVSPDGKYVYAAAETGGTVAIFKRDAG